MPASVSIVYEGKYMSRFGVNLFIHQRPYVPGQCEATHSGPILLRLNTNENPFGSLTQRCWPHIAWTGPTDSSSVVSRDNDAQT